MTSIGLPVKNNSAEAITQIPHSYVRQDRDGGLSFETGRKTGKLYVLVLCIAPKPIRALYATTWESIGLRLID